MTVQPGRRHPSSRLFFDRPLEPRDTGNVCLLLKAERNYHENTVKIATLGALGALATLLAACNTVDGVGKDVEAGGEVIQDTAQDVEEDIND